MTTNMAFLAGFTPNRRASTPACVDARPNFHTGHTCAHAASRYHVFWCESIPLTCDTGNRFLHTTRGVFCLVSSVKMPKKPPTFDAECLVKRCTLSVNDYRCWPTSASVLRPSFWAERDEVDSCTCRRRPGLTSPDRLTPHPLCHVTVGVLSLYADKAYLLLNKPSSNANNDVISPGNISVAERTLQEFPDCSLLRRHPAPPLSNYDPIVKAAKDRVRDRDSRAS